MAQAMTSTERDLREQLRQSVNAVRSAVRRVPDVALVEHLGLNEAGAAVLDANSALTQAQSITDELAQLDQLTDEGLLLVGNARMALEAIRALLALIVAEIDDRAA